jgi:hypothetical protein
MRIIKKVTKEVTVIDDILCNKCGNSCRGVDPSFDWEGLIEVGIIGGYGSTHLGDGNSYEFSLCESCLIALFQTFKHNPKVPD